MTVRTSLSLDGLCMNLLPMAVDMMLALGCRIPNSLHLSFVEDKRSLG